MREEWVNTMAQNYFQPEIETMPVEEIKKLQSERLVKQVKHIYDNVPFYKNKMDEAGIKPEDIHGVEDLHKLPFTEKDDLRDQYPYVLPRFSSNHRDGPYSTFCGYGNAGW